MIESKPSPIHGNGWFASEDIGAYELLPEQGKNHGFNSSCDPNIMLLTAKKKNKFGVYNQVVITKQPITRDAALEKKEVGKEKK